MKNSLAALMLAGVCLAGCQSTGVMPIGPEASLLSDDGRNTVTINLGRSRLADVYDGCMAARGLHEARGRIMTDWGHVRANRFHRDRPPEWPESVVGISQQGLALFVNAGRSAGWWP